MTEEELKTGLAQLRPDIPWAHHFDFGHGIESVTAESPVFYGKAIGLARFADLVIDIANQQTRHRSIRELRIVDLASAEGGHSIALAKAGAREVIGIEGRQLYVDRATFAAKALSVTNASFQQGDVRSLDPEVLGRFDLVLCSGILYHIDAENFAKVVRSLYELTTDIVVLSTHVATQWALGRHHLKGPVTAGLYQGYLFREHKDNESAEKRADKVRASLDNTMSFWPTPEALFRALMDVGFTHIHEQIRPTTRHDPNERLARPLLVLRR